MEKRNLGQTGIKLTLLGLGGFHLLEVSETEALSLVNRYLDAGGNYVETAAAYGRGASERKVGTAMRTRRNECFLATKVTDRDAEMACATIEQAVAEGHADESVLIHLEDNVRRAMWFPEYLPTRFEARHR